MPPPRPPSLSPARVSLSDDCFLPCVVGRCRAAFPRWWYNATSQACQEFIFGGCGGNGNNFGSKKECFWTCVRGGEEETAGTPLTDQRGAEKPATEAAPTSSHRRHRPAEDTIRFQEHCAAPRVTGRCRASFPRWFFDMETRTCKMFIYGGCGGNRNNYLLEEDCLSQCAAGGGELPGEEDSSAHGRLFPDSALHSTRAVILAVLLALLLASLVLVVVRICRQGRETSLSTVWSTVDADKELLMSSGYTL
ncbi:PREDICTED: kunitz-type protease inhibitor 2 [Gekko japonicus]|uniref:Kunitz-type protease inhibitor 2 n=1 Tax=Gekko japonicus TaxID=146911 RepID=A0ABM1JNU4_GEKJA|nr:PREDICTED: kunitz-type protease inhibitor 2 [Gekko japonicus]